MEHRTLQFDTFGLQGIPTSSNTAALYGMGQVPPEVHSASSFSSSAIGESTAPQNEGDFTLGLGADSGREASLASSATSTQDSLPRRPVRRIACTEKTTNEIIQRRHQTKADSPTDSVEAETEEANDEVDTSPLLSDAHQNAVMRMSGGLHGLSLTKEGDVRTHSKALSHPHQEILKRRPENSISSFARMETTTFYQQTTVRPALVGADVPVKQLSKSAKKRLKKKQKNQLQGSCFKLPCVQDPDASTNRAVNPVHDSQMLQVPSRSDQPELQTQLAALLIDMVPRVSTRFCQQGIQNLGSTCFLGSAMQFLLASSQFCWVMTALRSTQRVVDKGAFPVIYSMGSLANVLELQSESGDSSGSRRENVAPSDRFRPQAVVPNMLAPVVSMFQRRVHQERSAAGQDVQEFLLFILEHMDEEIVRIRRDHWNKGGNNGSNADPMELNMDDDDSWTTVGKKNKLSVHRTTGDMETSLLSSIFRGQVQSEVRVSGMVPSVTTHSFTMLILDVASPYVHTVEDAIDHYTAQDSISDYRISNSGKRVSATKVNQFGNLPPYLIVCLKVYTYTSLGLEKIDKQIGFGSTLNFKNSWMSNSRGHKQYRLIATCNHHGQGRGGDHYTANVLQRDGCWTNFNDSKVTAIHEPDVLSATPYLLMYERLW